MANLSYSWKFESKNIKILNNIRNISFGLFFYYLWAIKKYKLKKLGFEKNYLLYSYKNNFGAYFFY